MKKYVIKAQNKLFIVSADTLKEAKEKTGLKIFDWSTSYYFQVDNNWLAQGQPFILIEK